MLTILEGKTGRKGGRHSGVCTRGDAPRVLGVGGCWIDSAMIRSYEAEQESLAVKGHARGYAQQEYSSSFHSRRCVKAVPQSMCWVYFLHMRLQSSHARTKPYPGVVACFQGLIHHFPPVFGELTQCSIMSRQRFTGGKIACTTPVHHIDEVA